MRISLISVSKKRFKTAFPKDPVPPVIKRILFLNGYVQNKVGKLLFSPSNSISK